MTDKPSDRILLLSGGAVPFFVDDQRLISTARNHPDVYIDFGHCLFELVYFPIPGKDLADGSVGYRKYITEVEAAERMTEIRGITGDYRLVYVLTNGLEVIERMYRWLTTIGNRFPEAGLNRWQLVRYEDLEKKLSQGKN